MRYADGALVSALYCHVRVLGSFPGQGKIYMENRLNSDQPTHV